MMKNIPVTIALISTSLLSGQTFILGDYYDASGDGTVTGNSSLVEGTGLYDQTSNPIGATGDPSDYNAIMVGSDYGGNELWRAVTSFDLSGLPAAPTGFTYDVTDVTFILEVSGGTTASRPATLIDFYEGSSPTGAFTGNLLASNTFNSADSTFVPISFGPTSLDLNSDSIFTLTMDAPNAASNPGQNFYTFGSGLAPNNIGITGTDNSIKSPELQISYDLIPIPEPTTFALLAFSTLGFITARKRK